jgi:riboflavin synthase alpha subunit
MFTGIIQTVGTVASRGRAGLTIKAPLRARPGDSVAVNGACLTVTRPPKGGALTFDVSDETWRLTNLGELSAGEAVNLEPALRAGDALGGHLVSGHVDARARLLQLESLPGGFARLRVELPAALKGLVALKGSVAIDGISLTVTRVASKWLETVLVPHTLAHTNLGRREAGHTVNLEADLIARYVRAALSR